MSGVGLAGVVGFVASASTLLVYVAKIARIHNAFDISCRANATRPICTSLESDITSANTYSWIAFGGVCVSVVTTGICLGTLAKTSYKTGGRVYTLIQDCRRRSGYAALNEETQNPSL